MAAGQAFSFPTFVDALETYDFAPELVVPVVALALIGGEALAGVGLWLRRSPSAAVLGFIVAAVWTVLAAQAFARGLVVPNCGCFGRWLTQELRWWVLLEDAEFVFLAGWVLWRQRSTSTAGPVRQVVTP